MSSDDRKTKNDLAVLKAREDAMEEVAKMSLNDTIVFILEKNQVFDDAHDSHDTTYRAIHRALAYHLGSFEGMLQSEDKTQMKEVREKGIKEGHEHAELHLNGGNCDISHSLN